MFTITQLSLSLQRGYAPKLTYRQGEDFPVRPDNFQLKDLDYERPEEQLKVRDVEDYERRVRDAIDYGYIFTVSFSLRNKYCRFQGIRKSCTFTP